MSAHVHHLLSEAGTAAVRKAGPKPGLLSSFPTLHTDRLRDLGKDTKPLRACFLICKMERIKMHIPCRCCGD